LLLNRFRRAGAAVAVVSLALSQACYAYKPIAPSAAPSSGARVRVVLTPEGMTEMARYLGPNVAVAEGDLTTMRNDGTWVVAVDFVQQTNGVRQPWSGEGVVAFPPGYRSEVLQRTYMRNQSIVAGVTLTAVIVTIAILALNAAGALGGDGGGGTQPPP
jgi:hypothetical protein